MDPIISFISDGTLSNEQKEAEKIRRKFAKFWLLAENKSYWRSFGGSYLSCICLKAMDEILAELHEEICGSHTTCQSLAHRAITQGY